MATLRVVMVEPKHEGNVGSVARAMKNFGFQDLWMVKPCILGEEAKRRAMHGIDVLEGANVVENLDTALRGCDLVAATTGDPAVNEKKFLRLALSPEEFVERARESEGRVAVLFGREDFGLFNEELEKCDLLVTIPASPEYPVLNVSHAAAILFYELTKRERRGSTRRKASQLEKEKLIDAFEDIMDATDYPTHKRARNVVMFRRLIGRAVPTKWEFYALIGVFTRATKRIKKLEGG